jgi:hypothetical protein
VTRDTPTVCSTALLNTPDRVILVERGERPGVPADGGTGGRRFACNSCTTYATQGL